MSVLLQVKQLSIRFGIGEQSQYAVDDLSFSVNKGQTLALLGESGCGKSMTALAIMQLLPVAATVGSQSSVLLEQLELFDQSEVQLRQLRGRRLSMIFQDPMTALNPVLSIGEQITEVLRCHFSLDSKQSRERVIELLVEVGIPEPNRCYASYPHELSGGMKQRVGIAMALAGEPELLIADEPTTALDVTTQAQILTLLKTLQAKHQMSIILITHDLALAGQMADEVAVMYAGHIVEQAASQNFFQQLQHPYSQGLFAALPSSHKRDYALQGIGGFVDKVTHAQLQQCRFAERCQYALEQCFQQPPKTFSFSPGHLVRCHLVEQGQQFKPVTEQCRLQLAETTDDQLLTVKDLQVHFPIRKGLFKRTVGYVKAVDGVDLDIAYGETLALVGESGCGKSTVAQSILQLLPQTAGRVYFNGYDLAGVSSLDLRRLRRQMQIVFQDPFSAMDPRMLVGDIIAEGLDIQGVDAETRQQRIVELLEQVSLSVDSQYRYPHEFSGGQRQRICIARALAVQPKLIVCDEPTSALDVSVQAQIINLLKALQQQKDIAYLFITHNIGLVSYLADKIAVMYLGRIVEQGTVAEVLSNPKHPYTQMLLKAVPQLNQSLVVNKSIGDLPAPSAPPSGCAFHPRCSQVMSKCRSQYPDQNSVSATHCASCWLLDDQN